MTIKEVAEMAGVSTAAVSRYFNGGSLSEEKRKKIKKTIDKTQFSPNALAQTMRTGKSGNIGVIIPDIKSHSMSRVLTGLVSSLENDNYYAIIGCTYGEKEKEVQFIETMQRGSLDGIVLMGTVMTPHLKETINDCKIPVVITGQNFKGLTCVYHDDENAMHDMAELVLKKRKKVAFIGVNEADTATGKSRRKGVEKAFINNGLDFSKAPRETASFTAESGYEAGKRLVAAHPDIDGVICASDHIAHGVMRAFKEAGKKIPEDVSVTGVGDSWADMISEPQLTTVGLYYEDCGKVAGDLLLEMINDPDRSGRINQIKLGYTIIERGSI